MLESGHIKNMPLEKIKSAITRKRLKGARQRMKKAGLVTDGQVDYILRGARQEHIDEFADILSCEDPDERKRMVARLPYAKLVAFGEATSQLLD